MPHKVFVYGTLRDKDLQKKLLGRHLDSYPASLYGFKRDIIIIDDIEYPIILEDQKSKDAITGEYFEVSDKELSILDEYETDAYRRILITLNDKSKAWVYCK